MKRRVGWSGMVLLAGVLACDSGGGKDASAAKGAGKGEAHGKGEGKSKAKAKDDGAGKANREATDAASGKGKGKGKGTEVVDAVVEGKADPGGDGKAEGSGGGAKGIGAMDAEALRAAVAAVPEGEIDGTGALVLPAMHWAPARPVLDADAILLVGGVVRDVKKAKVDDARGEAWVVSARIEVEHVFADREPTPREGTKTAPLGARKFVVAELADGLVIGDRVIVYGVDYEGGQAMLERDGSNTRLGIKVADWSDPIVAAVKALGAGKADLADAAQRAAWEPYGKDALGCYAVQAHFTECDPECEAAADPLACIHACAEKRLGTTLTMCDRDL